ncbi:type II toxin-antitoxin system RelE/ParE family toxin [Clostridium sp. LBM24168]
MYNLRYLPIAQKDLTNIIEYVSNKSIKAALNLIYEFDQSISRLKQFPYSCKVYHIKLEDEYRLLIVKNYLVFYVVYDHDVEIRRIIYAKMDITKILK